MGQGLVLPLTPWSWSLVRNLYSNHDSHVFIQQLRMLKRRSSLAITKPNYKRQKTTITRSPSSGLTSAQAASVLRILKRRESQVKEKKYSYLNVNNMGVSYSGNVYDLLSNLTRGDGGLNSYTGFAITPTGIQVRYSWNTNQEYSTMRIICLQWFDSSVPVATGILQSAGAAIAPLSSTRVENKKLFKVLYDALDTKAPATAGAYGVGHGQFFIPASRLQEVRFNQADNSVHYGGLYILAISDDAIVAYPGFSMQAMTSFYDD